MTTTSRSGTQRKEAKQGFGSMVLVGLAIVAAYAIDWGFLSDKITDYPLFCSADFVNGNCSRAWQQGTPTAYTVNKDQQTVVAQQAGQAPERLKNCAVVDRTNWKCTDGYLETSVVDGNFGGSPSVRHVRKDEWLLAEAPSKTH